MNDRTRRAVLGHVYLLTNPALDGMVKIGFTTRPEPEIRATELSAATAIPLPFSVHWAWLVEHPSDWEAQIHVRLAACRVSKEREFFRIGADDAVKLINLLVHGTEDLSEVLRLEALNLVRLYRKHPDLFKQTDKLASQIEEAVGRT